MKRRLTTSQYIRRQTWDTNRILVQAAGQKARTEGEPLSACPRFEQYAGLRASELAAAWKQGWWEVDADLRQTKRLPYKEES